MTWNLSNPSAIYIGSEWYTRPESGLFNSSNTEQEIIQVSLSPNAPLPPPESGSSGLKIPILFGAVLALIAANVYLFMKLEENKADLSKSREQLLTEISNLRESAQISNQTSRRYVETLKSDLDAAQRRASSAVGAVREDAMKQVAETERKLKAEQERATQAVKQEIGKVEQTTLAANQKLSETVTTEVSAVKKEISENKSELDKTIDSLKKVTGDLGVTSGYVATNSKELLALKQLGERSYFEFNIVKGKQAVKISDIMILLKNADVKKNRYTIQIVADDKTVEKQNKSVNEPLQFYMAKYRQPCELVVNSVAKDRITGYLAQPKVLASR